MSQLHLMKSEGGCIPPSVVKRLTRYLTEVQTLRADGLDWVSSQELAEALGLTSSTVRQDLSHVDFSGISRRGYETQGLESVLTAVLGADTSWKAVVVGAGNLGRALALHEDFSRRGFSICGVFDADARKVGARVGALTVQGMRELAATVSARNVQIGIIAVPNSGAQSVADLLIVAGVQGLLNLALTHIVAPPNVSVIDSRVVSSMLELSHAIKTRAQSGTSSSRKR